MCQLVGILKKCKITHSPCIFDLRSLKRFKVQITGSTYNQSMLVLDVCGSEPWRKMVVTVPYSLN